MGVKYATHTPKPTNTACQMMKLKTKKSTYFHHIFLSLAMILMMIVYVRLYSRMVVLLMIKSMTPPHTILGAGLWAFELKIDYCFEFVKSDETKLRV